MKMAWQQQQSRFTVSDGRWLAMLVDTFEKTERLGNVPCDSASISALRARLTLPALPCEGADFRQQAMSHNDAARLDHQH